MAATLQQIKEKVRKITRSPSTSLLSEAQLEEYINTFVLYDFPEHLRLFYFKTTLTFFTIPFVDTYATDSVPGLEDFKNRYLTIHPPVYVAGRIIYLSQSRSEFFAAWPLNEALLQIGAGNGIITNYSGVLQTGARAPVLQNQVSFTSVDSNLSPITVYDVPQSGNNTIGDLYTNTDPSVLAGTINYVTGVYSFTFPAPPGPGAVIQAQVKPYQPSIPVSMLFYDTKFTFRPVPDRAYRVEMDAYIRPTELLNDAQEPGLQEFWQYIALGAAKKVFEDRMDMESVQQIMPAYEEQENLVHRRTIVQRTNERTATIYVANPMSGRGFNNVGYL